MERSLIILKPDAMERKLVGEILTRLERIGCNFIAAKILTPDLDLLNKHYQIEKLAPIVGQKSKDAGTDVGDDVVAFGRKVLQWNAESMMRGPVMAIVCEGDEGIVKRIRKIVGATDPAKADPGTIRGDFGIDSILKANKEQRGCYNLIHASGSVEEAEYEIKLWFPELQFED